MAYFRCGGGGIPSSLKTDMNAVLNKKFGTSTDYPPADWAPTVNLMGPLPEKTQASASVCSFDDGADDVPTKSLVVTIPPTLSGVSAVTETQTGRNLLGFPSVDFTYKNVRYYTVNGVLYLDGTSTGETSPVVDVFKVLCFTLPAGTYYFDRGSLALPTYIYKKSDGTQLRVNSGSFTLAETTECNLGFYVYNKSFSNQKADLMLNTGSTAITYEDATTPTTYTASLGRTIYGGTADIVNGVGTDNGKKIKLNTLSWSYDDTSYSYGFFLIPSNISDMTENLKFVCTNYINNGHPRNQLLDGEIGVFNLSNSNRRLVIRDDSCTTLEQFLTKIADYYLVYESTTDTPFTFTGQEINTRLGYNAFWSDSGDTEVTYRADIDLLLGGN